MPYKRKEVIGACTLYLGDCLGVLEGEIVTEDGEVVSDAPIDPEDEF